MTTGAGPNQAVTGATGGDGLRGARAAALTVYIAVSGLLLLGIWAAFFLAGSGLLGEGFEDDNLDPHRVVGHVLGLVALIMLVAVLVARPGRGLVIGTVAIFILTGFAQRLLAEADSRWVGALHVLDAGVILVLCFWLHLTARKVPRG